jgi:dCMP deaminase
LVTGEPCLACAKLIHHSGITVAYIVAGGYSSDVGCQYLRDYGVRVEYVNAEG